MVGVQAAKHFAVMVQHQPAEFRRAVLPKLKANVDVGQADPATYAVVYDRSQRDQGKNQLYGEQLECTSGTALEEAPIDNEEKCEPSTSRAGPHAGGVTRGSFASIRLRCAGLSRPRSRGCDAAYGLPAHAARSQCLLEIFVLVLKDDLGPPSSLYRMNVESTFASFSARKRQTKSA